MVVAPINIPALYHSSTNLHGFYISGSYLYLSLGVMMNIKRKVERINQVSLDLMTKTLSIIAYWLGVSLSFLLWKLSTVFRSGVKKSYWSDPEEKEDYKSQY